MTRCFGLSERRDAMHRVFSMQPVKILHACRNVHLVRDAMHRVFTILFLKILTQIANSSPQKYPPTLPLTDHYPNRGR